MSRHSARLARRPFRRFRQIAARRRSSGAWAAVATPPRPPLVAERAAHEVYAEECSLARDHLRQGRAGQAAEASRRALAALPRGVDAQRQLGLALLEVGEARPAAHAFSAALTADPLDVVSHVGLAECQELLEGPGAAEAAWQRAWEVEPSSSRSGEGRPAGIAERLQASRRAAGALDVREGPPPLTRAALARIHLRGRLYEHAAIEARAVLAKDPDRSDMRLTLAEAFWRAGESELAAAVAGELRERLPDCVAANLLVAIHWLAEGRDASDLMARVQAVDPAGSIAQTLFDDREVPALFGTDAFPDIAPPPAAFAPPPLSEPEPPDQSEAAVEQESEAVELADSAVQASQASEPDLAETQPLAVVEAAPVESELERTQPELTLTAAPEIESERVPELETSTEPQPAPEVEPVLAIASPSPSTERAELREPAAPDQPTDRSYERPAEHRNDDDSSADHRTTGNAAMSAGRYLDAVRAYGEWLRSLRAGESD